MVFPGDKDEGFANRGFGFVEFSSATDAAKALSLTQLAGRTLTIEASRVSKKAASSSKKQTKLVIRNLAFPATVGDVRDLFGTFGPLKHIPLPPKPLSYVVRAFGEDCMAVYYCVEINQRVRLS